MNRVDYQQILIQDIDNLNERGELNLNPWYQRRSVWTTSQKAFLINTIFVQMPIPSIYVRHTIDIDKGRSMREVVDGQQRVRTILEYLNDEFAAHHPRYKGRVFYSELKRTEKQALRSTNVSIGFLVGASDPDVIQIFGRLNSINKSLNQQEKRNARFGGEFKQFSLAQAAKRVQIWRDLGIFSANDISRMVEVQFTSELAINLLSGLQDYNAKRIDDVYAEYDDDFGPRDAIEERLERVFEIVAELDPAAVRDTIFSRNPLFFSLFVVLDSIRKLNATRIERALFAIDSSYNSDVPISDRSREDADFYVACTSSTQRIRSRRVRDKYIRARIK